MTPETMTFDDCIAKLTGSFCPHGAKAFFLKVRAFDCKLCLEETIKAYGDARVVEERGACAVVVERYPTPIDFCGAAGLAKAIRARSKPKCEYDSDLACWSAEKPRGPDYTEYHHDDEGCEA